MINENMKKVLVALRSGEYKQTQYRLQDSGGHCCLGVMCEVYEKETGVKLPRDGVSGFIVGSNLNKFPLVKSWVGLHEDIVADVNANIDLLVGMNDTFNNSFDEIADFIETE
jgi:hypothetical protein